MPAISWNNKILVDGGVLNALPDQQVKEFGMDLVIAVNVGSSLDQNCHIGDGIDAIQRAMEIMSFTLSSLDRQSADILLVPEVKGIDWTDFPGYEELIRRGEKAAESKIKTIHEMLNYRLGEKVIQWPKKVYAGLKKRGQQIFKAVSA